MRALVVFESMFGNTRDVAAAIADGLADHLEVELLEVGAAPATIPEDVELVVLGGPTHGHGMTTEQSRADSAKRFEGTIVSPRIGIREWLEGVVDVSRIPWIAFFDTRLKGPTLLWGSAAHGAEKRLRTARLRPVVPPESFFVGGPTGPVIDRLLDGELERARAWGASLASLVAQKAASEEPA